MVIERGQVTPFPTVCQPMNNNNVPAILRSLIIYGVCVPLAIFVGYSLANPLDLNTLGFYGVVACVLVSPIILRWHRELLVFSWSATITVFILPGSPALWLVMVCVSLTISILERIIESDLKFIKVPQLTWPLMFFFFVVIITAELTGGIGLKAFGGAVYGGKKYVYLIVGFLSYFAITARAIPPQKAVQYVGLFFLGKATAFVGDLFPVVPTWMHPLFLIFPPTIDSEDPFDVGTTRLAGISNAAIGVYFFLMARYGVRGIFLEGKLWRVALFGLTFVLVFLGGFRTQLALFLVSFLIMFFLEKLHRTPLLLVLILLGSTAAVAIVPLAPKLPWTFQRALAFLPLDLDADAVASAEDSTEWRLKMWSALLPQIPPHLLLGKGLAFSSAEYDEMMTGNIILQHMAERFDASEGSLALANDYHNGMISLVIPFGIWGVISVVWFLIAGIGVMWRNMKYCRPELKVAGQFLFVMYFYEAAYFMSCFGGLQIASELASFIGFLGLSIALNNGVCQPAQEVLAARSVVIPFRAMPRPRPAFQR